MVQGLINRHLQPEYFTNSTWLLFSVFWLPIVVEIQIQHKNGYCLWMMVLFSVLCILRQRRITNAVYYYYYNGFITTKWPLFICLLIIILYLYSNHNIICEVSLTKGPKINTSTYLTQTPPPQSDVVITSLLQLKLPSFIGNTNFYVVFVSQPQWVARLIIIFVVVFVSRSQ